MGIVLSAVANGCKMAFAPQNLMMSLQVGREKGRRTKDSQVHIYCNQGGTFSGTADPTNFQLCFIQSMSYDIHGYIIDKSKFNYISNPDFFFFFEFSLGFQICTSSFIQMLLRQLMYYTLQFQTEFFFDSHWFSMNVLPFQ